MAKNSKYRLGIDLGANSLGWCLVGLDDEGRPYRFIRMGVRIFPDGRDPKDGTSLAAARRLARSMRRRRDRFLKRRARLMRLMIEYGFMPPTKPERELLRALDPYELRRRGLDTALKPYEFGRALFHLNQRRGFQSNRKVDKAHQNEGSKIISAVSKVQAQMLADQARTIGEWLSHRHDLRAPIRARLNGQGAKSTYELYVLRNMIAQEFDAIWATQSALNPSLFTALARDILRDALLFQRKLRPVRPGKCPFEPDAYRAALALPSTQRFRIFQEVNHLRIRETGVAERALTRQERDRVAEALLQSRERSFDQLRKLLDLSEDAVFNLESAKRAKLRGDATGYALSRTTAFGTRWFRLPIDQQDAVTILLLETEQEDTVIAALQERFGLTDSEARAVAALLLIDGYGSLSRRAICKILPHLEADVVTYDVAANSAGYDHSRYRAGGELPKLPYYAEYLPHYIGTGTGERRDSIEKRYGRIANPTVHVGLNQLRAVVNAIIEKFGRPHEVVIELARELKLSRERKREIEQDQLKRQQDNDRHRQLLEEAGLPPKPANLIRMRLWEELGSSPTDRRCPYTGEMISFTRLFSPEVEVEHILPFSMTLDDSASNKTVSMRKANRDKGNRAPFEAFGHSPAGYDWEQILNRASSMPPPKRRRFGPDALAQYQADGDFLARHLTDTAFLGRLAREYLTAISPSNRVWSIPGRLTALLRSRWGLNSLLSDTNHKNRNDQRHHTIDAALVAVTDRGLLERISHLAGRGVDEGVNRFLEGLEEPWPGYRSGLEFGLSKVVVSYKPDHGTGARLHNDTAYGLVDPSQSLERPIEVVHRIPLLSLKNAEQVEQIRDVAVRDQIKNIIRGKTGKELTAALQAFSEKTQVRRIRIQQTLSVIAIRRQDGTPFKAYKGDSNYCYQVFAGKSGGDWRARITSTFDAARGDFGAIEDPLIMQLCVDDCIKLRRPESRGHTIYRVVKFSQGRIFLAPHIEGGNLKDRDADRTDPFKYLNCSSSRLKKFDAVQVVVDTLGQVWPVLYQHAGAEHVNDFETRRTKYLTDC